MGKWWCFHKWIEIDWWFEKTSEKGDLWGTKLQCKKCDKIKVEFEYR